MIATVVETKELVETVVSSLVAGVGVTVSFSLLILGATRYADMRRDERPMLAVVAAGLAVVGLAVTVAAIVLGIVVMTSK